MYILSSEKAEMYMLSVIKNVVDLVGDFISANLGGFISSSVIAFGGFLIKYIYQNQGVRSSIYTGWWEQHIYKIGDDNCSGKVVKTDYYLLKHSKNKYSGSLVINIEGIIRRMEPRTGRAWNVSGYLADEVLTLLYRAHEGQKSRGCIYVRMKSNDDYQGYYLEEHQDGKVDKTPLIIRKVTDAEKIKSLTEWNKKAKQQDKLKKKLARIR